MNYSIQRQLSVALENQPGRLAAIGRALASEGVNIKDLSIVDSIEQGVIRLITSDPVLAERVLNREGLHVVKADVLVFDLRDTPGQLALLSQSLADGQVNIDYAYGSEEPAEQRMRLVIKASPMTRACQIISTLGEL